MAEIGRDTPQKSLPRIRSAYFFLIRKD